MVWWNPAKQRGNGPSLQEVRDMALLTQQGFELHVKECRDRYMDSREKMDGVGKAIEKIATDTKAWRDAQADKWAAMQWKIILGLIGIVGTLLLKIIEFLPIHIGNGVTH